MVSNPFSAVSGAGIIYMDEFDTSVAMLNIVCAIYHYMVIYQFFTVYFDFPFFTYDVILLICLF